MAIVGSSTPEWPNNMQVLCVPNWSFGRTNVVLRQLRDELEKHPITIHFLASDVDHNRTVSAFSGAQEDVKAALFGAAEVVLPAIDLNRHVGCHPRIGALDVCPFIPFGRPRDPEGFSAWIDAIASELAARWDLPVFLYERSAREGKVASLPKLRKGGFGGLLGREIDPDYGPKEAHPLLGASVLGWRDFLIALNVNLKQEAAHTAAMLAEKIRVRRKDDPAFLGVRAMGFVLSSRGQSQLSMNLTMPDLTPMDPIVSWAIQGAQNAGVPVASTELIGVIRPKDMEHNTLVPVNPYQIVDMS